MNTENLLLTMKESCSNTAAFVTSRLQNAGLQVLQTFDSKNARSAESSCTCQHHGTAQCDCQLMVLLVYGKAGLPVSIVAHGYDGQTWLSLVETCDNANIAVEAEIRTALAPLTPYDIDSPEEPSCC